jgi:hypothetical protein
MIGLPFSQRSQRSRGAFITQKVCQSATQLADKNNGGQRFGYLIEIKV